MNCMYNKAVYLTLLLEKADHKMLVKLTQFHRHFMCSFFVHTCFAQLFSTYNFGFVTFCQKNIGTKTVRKILMKLTRMYRNNFFVMIVFIDGFLEQSLTSNIDTDTSHSFLVVTMRTRSIF